MTLDRADTVDLEMLLRRIIREEAGITAVAPAEKWRGGTLALRPGTPGLQEKVWPIETFFHKVVMLRNRLRTLEQQVNAAEQEMTGGQRGDESQADRAGRQHHGPRRSMHEQQQRDRADQRDRTERGDLVVGGARAVRRVWQQTR